MAYQVEVSNSIIDGFIRNHPQYQNAVDIAIREIRDNPNVDGKVKFYYPRPPVILTLYANNGIKVLYYKEIVGGVTIFRISYICI